MVNSGSSHTSALKDKRQSSPFLREKGSVSPSTSLKAILGKNVGDMKETIDFNYIMMMASSLRPGQSGGRSLRGLLSRETNEMTLTDPRRGVR